MKGFGRRLFVFLSRLFVPEQHQSDPIVSTKFVISQLLPPMYILSTWIGYMGLQANLIPPTWVLVIYLLLPVFVRLLKSHLVAVYGFVLVQCGSTMYVLTQIHPNFSMGATVIFLPLVAFLLVGPRSGTLLGLYALYIYFAGHYRWWPLFDSVAVTMPVAQFRLILIRVIGRNWTMSMLLIGLHRVVLRLIVKRKVEVVNAQERAFAAIWCVFPLWLVARFFYVPWSSLCLSLFHASHTRMVPSASEHLPASPVTTQTHRCMGTELRYL